MKDRSFAGKEEGKGVKKSRVVVGLDIGTTKIACFVGRKNEHNKIEIIGVGKSESLGVARGIVTNIQKTIDSISAAINTTKNNLDGNLNISTVYVGIAGQHISSIQHRGIYTRKGSKHDDLITQHDIDAFIDDMYEMVMRPGEEIISVIPQEYIIDGEPDIKEPIGMAGVRLEANFHIITGHVSNVKNIHTCIERSGLRVKDIILEPIASAASVLTDEEKEAGVVLVDIGGGTTDIAIFHDNIIRHTAVIPFGGNIITHDIKEGCQIMQAKAETLKVKFGSALASETNEHEVVCIPGLKGQQPKEITLKSLAGIIQARMEEIIALVDFEIKKSGYSKKILGGIVLTGGGAQLKHLPQLFSYMTGLDCRIGYPNEHLANTNEAELASPMFSTGIGLVLKGFEELEKQNRTVTQNEPVVEETPIKEPMDNNEPHVSGHSDPERKGSFFGTILRKYTDKVETFFKD